MGETGTFNEDSRIGKNSADDSPLLIHDRVKALYDAHRAEIYHFLLTRRLKPAAAQELTQDAFVQLFVSLSKGTVIESDRAWLYSVAAKSAVNHWRREGRYDYVALDASPELQGSLPSSEPTPEHVAIENQRNHRVGMLLAHMPENQRSVVHLRMQGLRYRAIAKVLEISPSTVSELLSGAIKRLRSIANE